MTQSLETDVIVISAGTAGLAAAIAAAEGGAKVISLEKSGNTGGTANMANGLFAVESRLQRIRQLTLTREQAFRMHMDFTHWRVDARLVRAYIDKSADTIDWLEKMGVEFYDPACHGCGMNYTWHIVKPASGRSGIGTAGTMMKIMAERARSLGVQILLKTPVKKILREGPAITGVLAENADGEDVRVSAGAVIAASGGWGGQYQDLPGLNGDGIRMAREVGASVKEKELPAGSGRPAGRGIPWGRMSFTVMEAFSQPGNLIVSLKGERFLNEELIPANIFWHNAFARQKERTAFKIFDEDTKERYVHTGFDMISGFSFGDREADTRASNFDEEFAGMLEDGAGNLFVADSIEELAAGTGIDPDGLKATVEEYNRACETGCDDVMNKNPRYLRPVRRPPFYASKQVWNAPTGEWEGIRINYRTEALTEEFEVIPGLYAAGTEAACNVYYDTYPNILPGNNMGFAINSGRIAGENAAEYALKKLG